MNKIDKQRYSVMDKSELVDMLGHLMDILDEHENTELYINTDLRDKVYNELFPA
jgi:hypothetical protein